MVSRFVQPSVSRRTTVCDTGTSDTIRTLQLVLFTALMLCGVALLSAPGAAQNSAPSHINLAMLLGDTQAGAPVLRNPSDHNQRVQKPSRAMTI